MFGKWFPAWYSAMNSTHAQHWPFIFLLKIPCSSPWPSRSYTCKRRFLKWVFSFRNARVKPLTSNRKRRKNVFPVQILFFLDGKIEENRHPFNGNSDIIGLDLTKEADGFKCKICVSLQEDCYTSIRCKHSCARQSSGDVGGCDATCGNCLFTAKSPTRW